MTHQERWAGISEALYAAQYDTSIRARQRGMRTALLLLGACKGGRARALKFKSWGDAWKGTTEPNDLIWLVKRINEYKQNAGFIDDPARFANVFTILNTIDKTVGATINPYHLHTCVGATQTKARTLAALRACFNMLGEIR